MNKKEIRKLANHKWWEHLFKKYKYVETEKGYKEYKQRRMWLVLLDGFCLIIFSPIFAIGIVISDFKNNTRFPDGWDGYECYTPIKKEINNENS